MRAKLSQNQVLAHIRQTKLSRLYPALDQAILGIMGVTPNFPIETLSFIAIVFVIFAILRIMNPKLFELYNAKKH